MALIDTDLLIISDLGGTNYKITADLLAQYVNAKAPIPGMSTNILDTDVFLISDTSSVNYKISADALAQYINTHPSAPSGGSGGLTDGKVMYSDDHGATWTQTDSVEPPPSYQPNQIGSRGYGNGVWILGINPTDSNSSSTARWQPEKIRRSTDGLTYTKVAIPGLDAEGSSASGRYNWLGLFYNPGTSTWWGFLDAVGFRGYAVKSTDGGVSWSNVVLHGATGADNHYLAKCFINTNDNTMVLQRAENGKPTVGYTSTNNGASWTQMTAWPGRVKSEAAGQGNLLVLTKNPDDMYISNGNNLNSWTPISVPFTPNAIAYGDTPDKFVATGNSKMWYSSNGTNWTRTTGGAADTPDSSWDSVSWSGTHFIALAQTKSASTTTTQIARSTDGVNWVHDTKTPELLNWGAPMGDNSGALVSTTGESSLNRPPVLLIEPRPQTSTPTRSGTAAADYDAYHYQSEEFGLSPYEETFGVYVDTGAFVIDEVQQPALTLIQYSSYKFDVSDPANAGYELRFYDDANKTTEQDGTLYTEGIPGEGEAFVAWSPLTVGTYSYQSKGHTGAGADIYVVPNYPENFLITVSGSVFYVNDVQQDSLTLDAGQTYRFDQSDSSNTGHPLKIYDDANKTTEITAGITIVGTPGTEGSFTQFIPVATGTYSYQCANHAAMGGDITVV